MTGCKGICNRYKAKRGLNKLGWYRQGFKRCQTCEIFIRWDDSQFCPCCKLRLRTKPRNKKDKEKLRMELN